MYSASNHPMKMDITKEVKEREREKQTNRNWVITKWVFSIGWEKKQKSLSNRKYVKMKWKWKENRKASTIIANRLILLHKINYLLSYFVRAAGLWISNFMFECVCVCGVSVWVFVFNTKKETKKKYTNIIIECSPSLSYWKRRLRYKAYVWITTNE